MSKTLTPEENERLISAAPAMLNMLYVIEAHLLDVIEGRGRGTSKMLLLRVQDLIKKVEL